MENIRYISLSIAEVVEGVLLHARGILDDESFDWPKSRVGLEAVLADLGAKSADDPAIERLRGFIATGDEAWKARRKDAPSLRFGFGAIGRAIPGR